MIHFKLKIFKALTTQIPHNEYGLPMYLLNYSELFPKNGTEDPTIVKDFDYYADYANNAIAEAIVDLDYDEGYPLFSANGAPIWEPFQDETRDEYFRTQLEKYIKMPLAAAQLKDELVTQEQLAPAYMRSLRYITTTQGELETVYAHSVFHHWATRAKAYDMYHITAAAKRREYLRYQQEHSQYTASTALLKKAEDLLNQMLDDAVAWEVKPSDVIRLWQLAIKAQRDAIDPEDIVELLPTTELMQRIASKLPQQQNQQYQITQQSMEKIEQLYFEGVTDGTA